MSSSKSPGTEYVLYVYTPSLVAAIIAIAVFGILTTAHIYRLLKTGTWFCIPFVVGGLCELAPTTT